MEDLIFHTRINMMKYIFLMIKIISKILEDLNKAEELIIREII
jgi:hypothetical protein